MLLLNTLLCFFSIWTFLPTVIVASSPSSAATNDILKLITNFRSPKNIAFSTQGGGSSHHMWVLEILKEMHHRGHNISFYSRGDQLRFAKDYPMIKPKQVGGPVDFVQHPSQAKLLSSHPRQDVLASASIEACMENYPSEFLEHQALFESENIDLVICDSFAVSCIDTAIVKKLPVVITSTFGLYADNSAPYINNQLFTATNPTSENDSLWFRIYRDYIQVPTLLWSLSNKLRHAHAFQRKLGLEPVVDTSATRYNGITKLVNNVFGIEVARKLSPLFHMVGPIMRSTYPSLDTLTANFLESHKRIAYVAFGQHARPSDQDVKMLLHALLRLMEQGDLDGVIWARLNKDQIPEMIETPKQLYSNHDIANHPDIYLINWAPQYAILQHPSISFFLSHGGVGSMHEALFSGKRLFVYPFFGDQPSNARAIERIGIGRYIDTYNMKYDHACYELLYKKLHQVASDPQNTIQNTVNRYSAYVQVSATNAIVRGADLLEESLFASDDQGKMYYRNDVGYEIHWIKRNNVDIYTVFVVLGVIAFKLGGSLLCYFLQRKAITHQKLKTL